MELTKEELKEINGGSIPGALVTSIIRGIGQIYEIGRGIGSAIRRFVTKRFC
ncbi:MAG: class IIb bacteriocin, lactobin A/cerein 7B family [Bacilli bacterium]|nr:class IIb bacteriocin, lactobin A/cerein 7B family [Bacilli bacterium]MBQ6282697.1 class IIb bacteriocin, lactobin A/cerein 7B family [Bacilli bacterium]